MVAADFSTFQDTLDDRGWTIKGQIGRILINANAEPIMSVIVVNGFFGVRVINTGRLISQAR